MARARWARARRLGWTRWSFTVIGAALLMVLAALLSGSAAPTAGAVPAAVGASAPASGSCGKAAGPFSVQGTQVLGAGGKVFVSYGITVSGLQDPNWQASLNQDLQEITATANDWCANTVRLQLSQDNLLGSNGTSFNQAYMSAIQAEVASAESDHLVVVLNDDTEQTTSAWNTELGPTAETEAFWGALAGAYGKDPQVIFDLFNEPRMYQSGMSPAQEWKLWLNGGQIFGVDYPIGMAQLAAFVRTTLKAHNVFWIEGPRYSVSFAGMVRWGAVLKVSGLVYAVHHPAPPNDSSGWYADFGYLAVQGIAPVVDGEWTNYEPPPAAGPATVPTSCWPGAPTVVPEFLAYLSALGIGLNAYDLQSGYLIKSDTDLDEPTTINASTWTCLANKERQIGQGAGSLVMAWFKQNNG